MKCRHCCTPMKFVTAQHLRAEHGYRSLHPVEAYKIRFRLTHGKSPATMERQRRTYILTLESQGRHWTAARVLTEIRDRHRRGQPLNAASVKGSSLFSSASRLFRSWMRAVMAAGVDYSKVRLLEEWSPDQVLKVLKQESRAGRSLQHRAVALRFPSLRNAALRHFGSWDKVLRKLGKNPDLVRGCRRKWTRETFCKRLRELRPKRLSELTISEEMAVYRFLGNWKAALRSVGLKWVPPSRNLKWSATIILEEIARRVAMGLPIRRMAVIRDRHTLVVAAEREFGRWARAVERAGYRKLLDREVAGEID